MPNINESINNEFINNNPEDNNEFKEYYENFYNYNN